MTDAERLDKYLSQVTDCIKHVCQLAQRGHDIEQFLVNLVGDLSLVMRLGGTIPRLETRIERMHAAAHDLYSQHEKENPREYGRNEHDHGGGLPADGIRPTGGQRG